MASFIKASLERSYAESFLTELERGDSQYFFFIAKSTAWTNDNSPPTYTDSVASEYEVMNNIIAYKKLSPSNLLFAVPRYTWTSGTTYDQYSDTADLFDDNDPKQFFVVTDQNNIYKCMSNNGGASSTEKPTQTLYGEFSLSDGYRWKYLATVRETDLPYELTDYVPIDFASLSTDTETTNQYNVQSTAVSGALTRIEATNSTVGASVGVYPSAVTSVLFNTTYTLYVNGYNSATKTITITDPTSVARITQPAADYVGYVVRVVSSGVNPAEINNYGIITSLTKASNQVTIVVRDDVVPFTVSPSSGSDVVSVEITPHILINGDGQRAYAKPVMNSSKQIVRVDLVDGGEDYSVARAEVVGKKNTDTVHPTLTPVLSPKGGHGSNILKELNVKDIIIIVEITEADAEKFIGGGSYRQFGIIKNPVLSDGTGKVAGSDDQFYRDITLQPDAAVNTDNIGTGFDGSPSNCILGTETFSSAKVVDLKSAQAPITIKTQNSSGRFTSYSDRRDRYRVSLDKDGQFLVNESVQQTVPAGVEVATGVSYGYDYLAEGIVVSQGGATLSVQLQTSGGFVGNYTLVGRESGFTAAVAAVSPEYGEYVWVFKGSSSPTLYDLNGDGQLFRVIDVGPAYYDTNNTPAYSGLTVLEIATSGNTQVGGADTTTSTLTVNSFSNGDGVTQGVTGSYTPYATGTVYHWNFVNPSYGKLYLTNVVGKFKGVATDGLTGTTLGAYIVASVAPPEVLATSGEVLYIDNVRPIQRTIAQEEEFRIRLGF